MKDKLLMALWYVVLVLLGLYLFSLLVTKVVAKTDHPYYDWNTGLIPMCHWTEGENSYVHIRANVNGIINGHGNHENDIIPVFDYGGCNGCSGHFNGLNLDKVSWIDNNCQEPEPTLEPTIEPTTEPTTTPEPTEEPTPTEEVTPTPSIEVPTPTPTEAPALVRGATSPVKVESGTSIPSVNEPTQCQDTIPYKVTDFWIENPVSGDNALTLRWGTSQDWNTVNIAYGENKYEWKYALLGTEDDGEEVIRGLDNGTHYWFQIAFTNGCAVSEYTEPQDPLP